MNYRSIIFSACMTSILGALAGWSFTYIGQPDLELRRFQSEFYQTLYHRYPLLGAGLGFMVGAGFATVSQAHKRRS
ncbi:hypothetical protein VZH09_11100 [Synechococcus elongatus IITB7]|uniref:hypothetical protein n=1 Tax=Synechococcus elongatus TaxID=32046 RepID=UPI0030D43058